MSNLAPEGVPSPVPVEDARQAQSVLNNQVFVPVAASPSIRPSHIAGGGTAGVVGAVVVAVCNHFHWHVSDVDAVLVGGAAVSAGVGLGHVIGKVGIYGAFKQLWRGSKV